MSKQAPDFSQYIGVDYGPYTSWDPVNATMIRHWCEVMGDSNPIYTDADAARTAGFKGIVAPPTMLQAWIMRGIEEQRAPGSDERDPFAVLVLLEQAGYSGIVAVNCEQGYECYLEEGDQVYFRSTIESISEEKTTALGVGFFVTEMSTYYNQRDAVVGTMRFQVFKFRPHEQTAAASGTTEPSKPRGMSRMRPVRNHDTAFFWQGVDAHELRIQRCGDCQTRGRHPPAPCIPSVSP